MRRRWRPSALVATPEEEAPWWPQLWWRRPVGLACAPPPGSRGEEGRENEKLGLGLRKLVYIWMSWALSRSNVTGRVMLPIFGSCPCRATMSRVRSRHSPTIRWAPEALSSSCCAVIVSSFLGSCPAVQSATAGRPSLWVTVSTYPTTHEPLTLIPHLVGILLELEKSGMDVKKYLR